MFGFGLGVALIGIGVVFSVLLFINVCIVLLSKSVNSLTKKPEKPVKTEMTVEKRLTKEEIVEVAATNEEYDLEIIAVIAAAIAQYAALDEKQYRITTIKRLPARLNNAWQTAGRQQIMQERLSYYG
ncbi:MAG: Oxaloacetate decarboxylase, gamma chain [Peptococcaceae bacterium]|jgi:sodium pump decarboxylase gamma subunit|nr:Oxaloacetate decarboxylase, gamma chain [Peptococcaceae bacterium]